MRRLLCPKVSSLCIVSTFEVNDSRLLEYMGDMMDLCFSKRGSNLEHKYLDAGTSTSARIMITCTLPLSEIVTDFFDQLKSRSSGFASFECVVAALKRHMRS